jgi:CRP/FNR family cyclic AMP-dependent transcriptional regulator
VSLPSQIPQSGRALTQGEYTELVTEMEDIVNRSHLFKSLDQAGRERVLESGYVETYGAGEEIFRQYEPGDTLLVLLRGRVHVKTETPAGEVSLAELGRGAVIGEVSVLNRSARTATVVAMTDVDAVAFAGHRIDRILDDYPKVRDLLRALVERRAADTIEKILA